MDDSSSSPYLVRGRSADDKASSAPSAAHCGRRGRCNEFSTLNLRYREQLRKHWDQVNKQVNLFAAEYEKCSREQGSGESLSDVRDRALLSYQSLYGDFKHFNIWALLREKQKFQEDEDHRRWWLHEQRKRNSSGGLQLDVHRGREFWHTDAHPMSYRRQGCEEQEEGEGDILLASRLPIADPDPDPGSTCLLGVGNGLNVADVVGHAQRPHEVYGSGQSRISPRVDR
ncbi:uncharacterized protein LOC121774748 [Salvia splendens]|uniref:uncharacterized protein LOC121774748 n=1 Tax=Salvia splendens TaxID=180675 RepID=UPI001C2660A7|nr:uncharacterized protein LOC121774748 [Salvia splendens]